MTSPTFAQCPVFEATPGAPEPTDEDTECAACIWIGDGDNHKGYPACEYGEVHQ